MRSESWMNKVVNSTTAYGHKYQHIIINIYRRYIHISVAPPYIDDGGSISPTYRVSDCKPPSLFDIPYL